MRVVRMQQTPAEKVVKKTAESRCESCRGRRSGRGEGESEAQAVSRAQPNKGRREQQSGASAKKADVRLASASGAVDGRACVMKAHSHTRGLVEGRKCISSQTQGSPSFFCSQTGRRADPLPRDCHAGTRWPQTPRSRWRVEGCRSRMSSKMRVRDDARDGDGSAGGLLVAGEERGGENAWGNGPTETGAKKDEKRPTAGLAGRQQREERLPLNFRRSCPSVSPGQHQ